MKENVVICFYGISSMNKALAEWNADGWTAINVNTAHGIGGNALYVLLEREKPTV